MLKFVERHLVGISLVVLSVSALLLVLASGLLGFGAVALINKIPGVEKSNNDRAYSGFNIKEGEEIIYKVMDRRHEDYFDLIAIQNTQNHEDVHIIIDGRENTKFIIARRINGLVKLEPKK